MSAKGLKGFIKPFVLPTPFAVGDVNSYLLIDEAVSIIDAGPNTEEAWTAFQQGLAQYGIRVKDIDQIIITHHHVDHYGLASRIQAESGANLFCHPLSGEHLTHLESRMQRSMEFFYRFYLEHGVPEPMAQKAWQWKKMYDTYGSAVDVAGWIEEGDQLPGHPEWAVYHMPGHSQDQLCFYNKEEQTMLSSDHLIKHISSNAILEAPEDGHERPKTLLQYRDSLQRCLDMEIRQALSGHGEPIDDVNGLIHHRLLRQEQRAEAILNTLQEGPAAAFEIAEALFGKRLYSDMPLVISEIIGHLDWLVDQAKVGMIKENNCVQYYKR